MAKIDIEKLRKVLEVVKKQYDFGENSGDPILKDPLMGTVRWQRTMVPTTRAIEIGLLREGFQLTPEIMYELVKQAKEMGDFTQAKKAKDNFTAQNRVDGLKKYLVRVVGMNKEFIDTGKYPSDDAKANDAQKLKDIETNVRDLNKKFPQILDPSRQSGDDIRDLVWKLFDPFAKGTFAFSSGLVNEDIDRKDINDGKHGSVIKYIAAVTGMLGAFRGGGRDLGSNVINEGSSIHAPIKKILSLRRSEKNKRELSDAISELTGLISFDEFKTVMANPWPYRNVLKGLGGVFDPTDKDDLWRYIEYFNEYKDYRKEKPEFKMLKVVDEYIFPKFVDGTIHDFQSFLKECAGVSADLGLGYFNIGGHYDDRKFLITGPHVLPIAAMSLINEFIKFQKNPEGMYEKYVEAVNNPKFVDYAMRAGLDPRINLEGMKKIFSVVKSFPDDPRYFNPQEPADVEAQIGPIEKYDYLTYLMEAYRDRTRQFNYSWESPNYTPKDLMVRYSKAMSQFLTNLGNDRELVEYLAAFGHSDGNAQLGARRISIAPQIGLRIMSMIADAFIDNGLAHHFGMTWDNVRDRTRTDVPFINHGVGADGGKVMEYATNKNDALGRHFLGSEYFEGEFKNNEWTNGIIEKTQFGKAIIYLLENINNALAKKDPAFKAFDLNNTGNPYFGSLLEPAILGNPKYRFVFLPEMIQHRVAERLRKGEDLGRFFPKNYTGTFWEPFDPQSMAAMCNYAYGNLPQLAATYPRLFIGPKAPLGEYDYGTWSDIGIDINNHTRVFDAISRSHFLTGYDFTNNTGFTSEAITRKGQPITHPVVNYMREFRRRMDNGDRSFVYNRILGTPGAVRLYPGDLYMMGVINPIVNGSINFNKITSLPGYGWYNKLSPGERKFLWTRLANRWQEMNNSTDFNKGLMESVRKIFVDSNKRFPKTLGNNFTLIKNFNDFFNEVNESNSAMKYAFTDRSLKFSKLSQDEIDKVNDYLRDHGLDGFTGFGAISIEKFNDITAPQWNDTPHTAHSDDVMNIVNDVIRKDPVKSSIFMDYITDLFGDSSENRRYAWAMLNHPYHFKDDYVDIRIIKGVNAIAERGEYPRIHGKEIEFNDGSTALKKNYIPTGVYPYGDPGDNSDIEEKKAIIERIPGKGRIAREMLGSVLDEFQEYFSESVDTDNEKGEDFADWFIKNVPMYRLKELDNIDYKGYSRHLLRQLVPKIQSGDAVRLRHGLPNRGIYQRESNVLPNIDDYRESLRETFNDFVNSINGTNKNSQDLMEQFLESDSLDNLEDRADEIAANRNEQYAQSFDESKKDFAKSITDADDKIYARKYLKFASIVADGGFMNRMKVLGSLFNYYMRVGRGSKMTFDQTLADYLHNADENWLNSLSKVNAEIFDKNFGLLKSIIQKGSIRSLYALTKDVIRAKYGDKGGYAIRPQSPARLVRDFGGEDVTPILENILKKNYGDNGLIPKKDLAEAYLLLSEDGFGKLFDRFGLKGEDEEKLYYIDRIKGRPGREKLLRDYLSILYPKQHPGQELYDQLLEDPLSFYFYLPEWSAGELYRIANAGDYNDGEAKPPRYRRQPTPGPKQSPGPGANDATPTPEPSPSADQPQEEESEEEESATEEPEGKGSAGGEPTPGPSPSMEPTPTNEPPAGTPGPNPDPTRSDNETTTEQEEESEEEESATEEQPGKGSETEEQPGKGSEPEDEQGEEAEEEESATEEPEATPTPGPEPEQEESESEESTPEPRETPEPGPDPYESYLNDPNAPLDLAKEHQNMIRKKYEAVRQMLDNRDNPDLDPAVKEATDKLINRNIEYYEDSEYYKEGSEGDEYYEGLAAYLTTVVPYRVILSALNGKEHHYDDEDFYEGHFLDGDASFAEKAGVVKGWTNKGRFTGKEDPQSASQGGTGATPEPGASTSSGTSGSSTPPNEEQRRGELLNYKRYLLRDMLNDNEGRFSYESNRRLQALLDKNSDGYEGSRFFDKNNLDASKFNKDTYDKGLIEYLSRNVPVKKLDAIADDTDYNDYTDEDREELRFLNSDDPEWKDPNVQPTQEGPAGPEPSPVVEEFNKKVWESLKFYPDLMEKFQRYLENRKSTSTTPWGDLNIAEMTQLATILDAEKKAQSQRVKNWYNDLYDSNDKADQIIFNAIKREARYYNMGIYQLLNNRGDEWRNALNSRVNFRTIRDGKEKRANFIKWFNSLSDSDRNLLDEKMRENSNFFSSKYGYFADIVNAQRLLNEAKGDQGSDSQPTPEPEASAGPQPSSSPQPGASTPPPSSSQQPGASTSQQPEQQPQPEQAPGAAQQPTGPLQPDPLQNTARSGPNRRFSFYNQGQQPDDGRDMYDQDEQWFDSGGSTRRDEEADNDEEREEEEQPSDTPKINKGGKKEEDIFESGGDPFAGIDLGELPDDFGQYDDFRSYGKKRDLVENTERKYARLYQHNMKNFKNAFNDYIKGDGPPNETLEQYQQRIGAEVNPNQVYGYTNDFSALGRNPNYDPLKEVTPRNHPTRGNTGRAKVKKKIKGGGFTDPRVNDILGQFYNNDYDSPTGLEDLIAAYTENKLGEE
jgi:hypothetical protein